MKEEGELARVVETGLQWVLWHWNKIEKSQHRNCS